MKLNLFLKRQDERKAVSNLAVIFLFILSTLFFLNVASAISVDIPVPLNYSVLIQNVTANATNCWITTEGIKCDVSDITYDEISGGDVNALGYTGTFNFLAGVIGQLSMDGDPWYLGGTDLELGKELTVDGYSYLNDTFPLTSLTHDLGSGALRWRVLYVQNISAENIDAFNLVLSENLTVGGFINGVNISNLSNIYVPYVGMLNDVDFEGNDIQDISVIYSNLGGSYDVFNSALYDENGVMFMAGASGARYLANSAGNIVFDWENKQFYLDDATTVLDWGLRALYDDGGDLSVDWENRMLYEDTGTFVILDYSTEGLASFFGNITTTGNLTAKGLTDFGADLTGTGAGAEFFKDAVNGDNKDINISGFGSGWGAGANFKKWTGTIGIDTFGRLAFGDAFSAIFNTALAVNENVEFGLGNSGGFVSITNLGQAQTTSGVFFRPQSTHNFLAMIPNTFWDWGISNPDDPTFYVFSGRSDGTKYSYIRMYTNQTTDIGMIESGVNITSFGNDNITTIGTGTDGYHVVNQTADSQGISIYGFDDKSAENFNLNIDASGYARFLSSQQMQFSSTAGHISFFSGAESYIYLDSADNIYFDLGDAAGAKEFQVRDSGGVAVATIDSDGGLFSVNGNFTRNLSIGNSTGYSFFDNGVLKMFDSARVTKEVVFKAQTATKGASAPDDVTRAVGASGGITMPVVSFSKVTLQEIQGEFHLPDDIDPTEDVEFHLMWIPGDAWTAGNYNWTLEYLVKEEEEDITIGTPTMISMTVTPSNADDMIETRFTNTIDADAQQIIFAHFFRDVDTDNGDDVGEVVFFEVKYTSNKLGTAI